MEVATWSLWSLHARSSSSPTTRLNALYHSSLAPHTRQEFISLRLWRISSIFASPAARQTQASRPGPKVLGKFVLRRGKATLLNQQKNKMKIKPKRMLATSLRHTRRLALVFVVAGAACVQSEKDWTFRLSAVPSLAESSLRYIDSQQYE